MTLGRLMELYQAEQQGKQIMLSAFEHRYDESRHYITEVKLSDEELKDLVLDEQHDDDTTYSYHYFIKDEEDEYGNKLNSKK